MCIKYLPQALDGCILLCRTQDLHWLSASAFMCISSGYHKLCMDAFFCVIARISTAPQLSCRTVINKASTYVIASMIHPYMFCHLIIAYIYHIYSFACSFIHICIYFIIAFTISFYIIYMSLLNCCTYTLLRSLSCIVIALGGRNARSYKDSIN